MKEFIRWILYYNGKKKKLGKTGWLLMDNCSTHCLPPVADPVVWEAAEVRFRGFKLSNGNVVFLPPKIVMLSASKIHYGLVVLAFAWLVPSQAFTLSSHSSFLAKAGEFLKGNRIKFGSNLGRYTSHQRRSIMSSLSGGGWSK